MRNEKYTVLTNKIDMSEAFGIFDSKEAATEHAIKLIKMYEHVEEEEEIQEILEDGEYSVIVLYENGVL